jgi:transcriptional regulator with XRE-family HTH domain
MKNIRDERIKQGLSQHALAQRCGYHEQQITRWEQGHNQPSIAAIDDLAYGLGFTLKLERIDAKQTSPTEIQSWEVTLW